MENNEDRKTPAQWVLVICGGVCFAAAVLVGYAVFTGLFGAETIEILNPLFWVLLMAANILLACANWKKQKVLSTVQIGLWSFFLGAFVFRMISLLAN